MAGMWNLPLECPFSPFSKWIRLVQSWRDTCGGFLSCSPSCAWWNVAKHMDGWWFISLYDFLEKAEIHSDCTIPPTVRYWSFCLNGTRICSVSNFQSMIPEMFSKWMPSSCVVFVWPCLLFEALLIRVLLYPDRWRGIYQLIYLVVLSQVRGHCPKCL